MTLCEAKVIHGYIRTWQKNWNFFTPFTIFPIILINLTDDDLSIEGKKTETPCEFPSQLHQEILERAVTLAKIAYQAGSTATIAAQSNKNNQQQ